MMAKHFARNARVFEAVVRGKTYAVAGYRECSETREFSRTVRSHWTAGSYQEAGVLCRLKFSQDCISNNALYRISGTW